VLERLRQLRLKRLVRIVTVQAVGLLKRLAPMRLLGLLIVSVVTAPTERRRIFRQVELIFPLVRFANLVRRVARGATHVERGMAAPLRGNIQACRVASETKILSLAAFCGFQKLILILGIVRVVADKAVMRDWGVNFRLSRTTSLPLMATETHLRGASLD